MVEQGNENLALFITRELNNIEESCSIIINANEKKRSKYFQNELLFIVIM